MSTFTFQGANKKITANPHFKVKANFQISQFFKFPASQECFVTTEPCISKLGISSTNWTIAGTTSTTKNNAVNLPFG